ncbi:unnamed protein product [Caretta caretta]
MFLQRNSFADQSLLQGLFDLLVPQTVGDGVEEWDNNGIESRNNVVGVVGWKGLGLDVDENAGSIEDNDHNEVRRTSGECFLAAPCGGDVENSGDDTSIGKDYYRKENQQDKQGSDKICQCCPGHVYAG